MNPSANVIEGIAAVLSMFLNLIQLLVIASAILSWVGDRNNQIVIMISNLTEPIYRPIRSFTRRLPGPFDWAPLVVIAIVVFLNIALVSSLREYAMTLKQAEITRPEGTLR